MSGYTYYLQGIWGTSSNDIFAVGSLGTILHYSDGYRLMIAPLGTSSASGGTVTGNGINCSWTGNTVSGTCAVNLDANTAVTLRALPNNDSIFHGWFMGSGSAAGCSGTGDCKFNIMETSDLGAVFFLQQAGYYQLTITPSGTGSGTVSGNEINCSWNGSNSSGTCNIGLAENTVVNLTASPGSGSTFNGWVNGSGSASSCSGKGACTFTITSVSGVGSTFGSGGQIYMPLILRD